jgi:hypothetical protein
MITRSIRGFDGEVGGDRVGLVLEGLITLFSDNRPIPPNGIWVLPLTSWGRPARPELNRS